MGIAEYISTHHAQILFIVAGISFVVELTVMGLSGPLLFFAIASFVTALLILAGMISGWEMELFTLGITTGVVALVLWKPLKSFQNAGDGRDNSSDMIGLKVSCTKTISPHEQGSIRYSGIDWPARMESGQQESVSAGEQCEIAAIEGNTMIVRSL